MSNNASPLFYVLGEVLLCALVATAYAQQLPSGDEIPSTFRADAEFAAHVRSVLVPYSEPASLHNDVGNTVLKTLIERMTPVRVNYAWELRIAKDAGNVFSSPDGTIYMDEGLAQALGNQSGLWAAALSHEIAHVINRDWARRYLLQQQLQHRQSSQIVMGENTFDGSWVEPKTAEGVLAGSSQSMELQADAEGLMLMARAGFHPDFVPALHHFLQAQQLEQSLSDSSHPAWQVRDEKLQRTQVLAGREYDRLWPERYLSPGGNPPKVVYAGSPRAKLSTKGELELMVPLHCENLSGSVEVILDLLGLDFGPLEARQFTGCTSPRTWITFTLPPIQSLRKPAQAKLDVSVLDDSGAILTRAPGATPVH